MSKIKATHRVTVYRDANDNEVAVARCETCEGHGCETCKGLGFIRVSQDALAATGHIQGEKKP
jgi:hypothetical protein